MDKADILYIHPLGGHPSDNDSYFLSKQKYSLKISREEKYYSFLPMGVVGIINNVRDKGYSVVGINCPLKKALYNLELQSLLNFNGVKIILIDIHWYIHMKNAMAIAKLCKEKFPKTKVVVGGMTATIFAKELIKLDFIDFVIKGDGEKPFEALVEAIFKDKGFEDIPNLCCKYHDNPLVYFAKDIDNYNYVDIDFMQDYKQYLDMFNFWLPIAKGCVYDCKFCDGNKEIYPFLYGRNRLIVRDANKVIADIKKLENKVEFVNFSHDLAMLGKDFWDSLLALKYNIGVRNEFFQLPPKELILKLAKCFLALDLVFSPIAGGDRERRKYGKKFSNKEFFGLLKFINKLHFNGGVTVYFSDYLVSQLGVVKLSERKRTRMIRKIKKIMPSAIIEVQTQLADPMCLIVNNKIPAEKLFKTLI